MQKTKTCTKCNRELPLTDSYFYRNVTSRDGLSYYCRECVGYSFDLYKHSNEKYKVCTECEKSLPATSEYFYKCNTGKYGVRAKCKKCISSINKCKDNKKEQSYRKYYYKKNKNERLAYGKKYYEENREKCKANAKNHNKKRTDILGKSRRYYARKNKLLSLPYSLTIEEWNKITSYFNCECAYCGLKEEDHLDLYGEHLHREHFIPLEKGGGYEAGNILPSCRPCNSSKGNKDFFKWYPEYEKYSMEKHSKILRYLNYKI